MNIVEFFLISEEHSNSWFTTAQGPFPDFRVNPAPAWRQHTVPRWIESGKGRHTGRSASEYSTYPIRGIPTRGVDTAVLPCIRSA